MSFENILKKAQTDIEQYGWSSMYVDANKVRGMESYTHTIGFESTYGHPEIITFGLPGESAHGVLSAVAQAIKEGESMALHTPVDNVLGGDFQVIFKPLDQAAYDDYLSVAIKTYDTKDFRTQIMLWPDKEGQFPTDNAYSIQGQLTAVKVISASDEFEAPPLKPPGTYH